LRIQVRCGWGIVDSLSGTQYVRKSANVLHARVLSQVVGGGRFGSSAVGTGSVTPIAGTQGGWFWLDGFTCVGKDLASEECMATATVPVAHKRADHVFFPAMALLILAIVVIGFGQSYFLNGMMFGKLPSMWVHIHGALFMTWIFLLLIQNLLIVARRVSWHITLGSVAVVLLPLMVIFGWLVLVDSIRRDAIGIPGELILVGDVEELGLFAGLTIWGLLVRREAAAHKRLMTLGTMAMLGPAINRWPFPAGIRLPATIGVYVAVPLLLVAYDLWSRRRVHRTTAVGYALMAAGILTLIPVANLNVFHQCVLWIRR
jgi:hypothetical protein